MTPLEKQLSEALAYSRNVIAHVKGSEIPMREPKSKILSMLDAALVAFDAAQASKPTAEPARTEAGETLYTTALYTRLKDLKYARMYIAACPKDSDAAFLQAVQDVASSIAAPPAGTPSSTPYSNTCRHCGESTVGGPHVCGPEAYR